jgi:hypothetical protein
MSLANVRHNGVRSLAVRCEVCRHKVILNVDAYADEVTVPSHRSEDGLRALRDIGRRCAAELEGAAGAREPDRQALELTGPEEQDPRSSAAP